MWQLVSFQTIKIVWKKPNKQNQREAIPKHKEEIDINKIMISVGDEKVFQTISLLVFVSNNVNKATQNKFTT